MAVIFITNFITEFVHILRLAQDIYELTSLTQEAIHGYFLSLQFMLEVLYLFETL